MGTIQTIVLGIKPCYPLGGAATCFDPTTSLASGCTVDDTSEVIKMCCPSGISQGYYNDMTVTCDGGEVVEDEIGANETDASETPVVMPVPDDSLSVNSAATDSSIQVTKTVFAVFAATSVGLVGWMAI